MAAHAVHAGTRPASRVVVWFRNDLRVRDNSALCAASSELAAARGSESDAARGVIGLFVLAPDQWDNHKLGVARLDFVLRNLRALKSELERNLHIPLLLRLAPPSRGRGHIKAVAELVAQTCREVGADRLFFNVEYEVDEAARDALVTRLLAPDGVHVRGFHDQCVVPPTAVKDKAGKPFIVYTQFKNAWLAAIRADPQLARVRDAPKASSPAWLETTRPFNNFAVPESVGALPGWNTAERKDLEPAPLRADLFPAGEAHAHERLKRFAERKALRYKEDRDFPALDSTSVLSPYLAVGVISPRQCVAAVAAVNNEQIERGNAGVVHWVSEVAWRDFFRHILVSFPSVCKGKAFLQHTDKLPWRYDEADFARWKEGRTGYPLVDAAMRQLNTTGWMHNRMRMLAANFLAKDLFIEWRWGEEYFSRHLIDADLASNNGGWQWAASTGTDAAPYFRVFSPVCQSEKFDADGEFIRKFVPELRNVPARHIHEPWKHYSAAALNAMGYCMPMLDHEKAKLRVMEAFAALGKEDGNKGLKQWDMSGGGGSGKSDRGGRQRRGGGRALPN